LREPWPLCEAIHVIFFSKQENYSGKNHYFH
jgi:hypothetical protein